MTDKLNQTGIRIGAFRCGGGIIDTGDISGIKKQFAHIWKKGKRKIGDIQIYTILYSFSKNELNPNHPESCETAASIVDTVIKKLYPGHQYTLVAQKDGKSGCVHVHVSVNALHSKTLKACRGKQTSFIAIRDEIENELQRNGIEIDYGLSHKKAERKIKSKREKIQKKEAYVWTDDLLARIQTSLALTTRFAEFDSILEMHGVEVKRKTKSNWTFALKNAKDSKYNGKKARGTRLSTLLTPSNIRKRIDENYNNLEKKKRVQYLEQELSKGSNVYENNIGFEDQII